MKPPGHVLLLLDAVWTLFLVVVIGPPIAATVALYGLVGAWISPWVNALLIPLWALFFLGAMILTTWIVRLLLPRVRAGDYPFPGHPMARAWALGFALQRVVYLPLWRVPIFCLAGLRTLLLRALGARVALSIQTGSDPQLLDAPLLTIEPGAMIASGCLLSGHLLMADGRLRLAEIHLREGASLSEHVHVGPGVTFDRGSVVGPSCLIGPGSRLGVDAYVGMGCRLVAEVEIGDGARLGHFVTCERGVRVGAGATVASRTHLARGTVIPAGAHVGERPAPLDGLEDADDA